MDSDRLNRWLSLGANIAAVAGIVFLGVEVRQNNELLDAAARYNHKETRANWMKQLNSDSGIAEIIVKARAGEELTATEEFKLDYYYCQTFAGFEWEFIESRADRFEIPINGYRSVFGLLPETDIQKFLGVTDAWEARKSGYLQKFVDFMDENILN